MPNSNRVPTWLVLGSGVRGPSILVTSGQFLGRQAASVSFGVSWNMDGSAGNGNPAVTTAGAITAQKLNQSGTRVPLLGGAPAGVFTVEGSDNDVYYADLGVTVSSLFGVATSGIRLINLSGALPDYIRLRYQNTASSGVFNVSFASRGFGAGS